MTSESQIDVPQSFVALFVARPGAKPSASRAHIEERYGLCEDLATLLTDTARRMLLDLGITEHDVLQRCLAGLQGPESLVNPAEATWVVCRLAELCGWPVPLISG